MRRWISALLVGALPLGCSLAPQNIAGAQVDVSAMEAFVEQLAADYNLSVAIGVSRDGIPLLSDGFGWADRASEIPITSSTRFRIGSLTKQFTAMAVLILRDEGLVELTSPVRQYLPELPESWRAITVHQLLTHTSGIMHSWAQPEFVERMAEPRTPRQVVESFYDEPLLFQPGEGFAYSGVGYFVLALLVERLSDQPYESFLRERIFEPLGMTATGAEGPDATIPGLARGYSWREGAVREAAPVHMPVFTGGGNLYSSVDDLLKWDRALAQQKLISAESYEAMYSPEREAYAYGWSVRRQDDRTVYSHSGGVPGFNAYIARYPESGIAVVILSNMEGVGVGGIGDAVALKALQGSDLAEGAWTGVFSPPGGGYWDVEFDLVRNGNSVDITVTNWPESYRIENVLLSNGRMSFSFTFYDDQAECSLVLETAGSYFGPCVVGGSEQAAMRVRPPGR